MLIDRLVGLGRLVLLLSFNVLNVVVAQSFREYEKNIRLLKANVPTSRINLDQLSGEMRYPRQVIGGEDPNAVNPGSLFLANPISCIVLRDSVYICDWKLNAVIVSTMDGQLVRKIGRSGKAPGEFINPAGIATNGDVVAVYDTQNARVQLFDTGFNYLGSFPVTFPVFVITLSFTNNSLITHGDYHDTLLVRERWLMKPWSLKRSFLPLIVPPRDKAAGFNQAIFAANKRGWVCAGYDAFPYLFVFDSLGNHVHSIVFEGKVVDDFEKPLARGARMIGGGLQFRRFTTALWLEDDNTIILGRGSDLYIFKLAEQGYVFKRRLNLRYKEKSQEITRQRREERILIASIFREKNTIYITDTVWLSYPWVLVYDF